MAREARAALLVLVLPLLAAVGPAYPARQSDLQPGEIQLRGRIQETDPTGQSLVLTAESFTLPNGRSQLIRPAKAKTVLLSGETRVYLYGDPGHPLAATDLARGMLVVGTGTDLGTGRPLPAREIVLWEIRPVYRPPIQGDVQRRFQTFEMELKLDLSQLATMVPDEDLPSELTLQVREVEEREETVLSPGRLQAHYLRMDKTETSMGDEEVEQKPVAGKTYIIERQGDELLITTPDGEPPPDEETAFVSADYADWGRPGALTEFFSGKVLTIGEPLTLPEPVYRALLADEDEEEDAELKEFRVVLKETRTIDDIRCAVFDAVLRVASEEDEGVVIGLDLSGEMAVALDSMQVVAGRLQGPVSVEVSEEADEDARGIKGEGTAMLTMRTEFGRAEQ